MIFNRLHATSAHGIKLLVVYPGWKWFSIVKGFNGQGGSPHHPYNQRSLVHDQKEPLNRRVSPVVWSGENGLHQIYFPKTHYAGMNTSPTPNTDVGMQPKREERAGLVLNYPMTPPSYRTDSDDKGKNYRIQL